MVASSMTTAPGQRLGPYELLAPLGAGGMGQVFRARDVRLGRDVALKLLPADSAVDPDRVRRFEQEARAASSIEHPAVLTVHDVGSEGGQRYLVTELLEGETLRSRLDRGPLPAAELLSIASQLADGLAAAHARGVVHRDLKPENLFLTRDGRLKILDFGIARLESRTPTELTLSDAGTSPGTILGTAGYMSPEQVRGLPTDARTDLFSLGAILYELATGRRAFPGETAIDRALAIVREDPPPVGRPDLPAVVDELVRGCTAKALEARVQSAREVTQRLEAVRRERHLAPATAGHTSGPNVALREPRSRVRARVVAGWMLTVAVAGIAGHQLARPTPAAAPHRAEFQRITFRSGYVGNARFAPDGRNVIYTAFTGFKVPRTYITLPGLPEARPLTEPGVILQSVSAQGELAVTLIDLEKSNRPAVLAQVPMGGGAPRALREHVWTADWSPRGDALAGVVEESGATTLEYPLGTTLYRSEGWMSALRVSPDGELIAFTDHPHGHDDMGYIAVVDRQGRARRLTPRYGSVAGLAWMPSGREIVFTAARTGLGRAVYVVDLEGQVREGPNAPVDMMVTDVSPDGTVLLKRETMALEVRGRAKDTLIERNLSWFDWGVPAGVTDDGQAYAFVEGGAAGGARYIAYYRRLDGSPPVRLGDGSVAALSGDGRWVALIPDNDRTRMALVPTGLGVLQPLPPGPIRAYETVTFLPGSRGLLIGGRGEDGQVRLYVQPIEPLGPPVLSGIDEPILATSILEVSPDGAEVLLGVPETGRMVRRAIATGEAHEVPGLHRHDHVARWTDKGKLIVLTATLACAPARSPSYAALAELEASLAELATRGDVAGIVRHARESSQRFALDEAPDCDPYATGYDIAVLEVDLETGERTEVRRLFGAEGLAGTRGHGTFHGVASARFSRDGEAYVLSLKHVSSDLFLMRM
jgi:hypothetical protein